MYDNAIKRLESIECHAFVKSNIPKIPGVVNHIFTNLLQKKILGRHSRRIIKNNLTI